jgi:hypothetical protein
MTDFQPAELLRVLHEHEVRYVLIGGLAATLYGSTSPTFDVDITPDTAEENLARLSAALTALDARIRVEGIPDGLPFVHDAKRLADITMLNLVTRCGDLDVASQPAGVSDFAAWDADATDIVIIDLPVRVASLDNLVRSKEAAGRDKDRLQLPVLRALRDRLHRGQA